MGVLGGLVDTPPTPVIYSGCDPRSADMSVPKFQQLADQFRDKIRAGVLKPGDVLPSYSQLEEQGWKHTTIVRAMGDLRSTGWTRHQQGEGIFVHDHPPV